MWREPGMNTVWMRYAAMACGLSKFLVFPPNCGKPYFNDTFDGERQYWRPHTDAGDSLRLEAFLSLRVVYEKTDNVLSIQWVRPERNLTLLISTLRKNNSEQHRRELIIEAGSMMFRLYGERLAHTFESLDTYLEFMKVRPSVVAIRSLQENRRLPVPLLNAEAEQQAETIRQRLQRRLYTSIPTAADLHYLNHIGVYLDEPRFWCSHDTENRYATYTGFVQGFKVANKLNNPLSGTSDNE